MANQRVLVADDESAWQKILKRELEGLGCKVDIASNYNEVRELLDANVYALIVCDNSMPHRNTGIELTAHAHLDGRHATTPFVLHTADDTKQVQDTVKQLGGIYRNKSSDEYIGDFLARILAK